VGFWCPAYSGPGIQVPGFHLHYISADRARGGHVLQLSLEEAEAQSIEVRQDMRASRSVQSKAREAKAG
jgi:acetolactate decarboxylase